MIERINWKCVMADLKVLRLLTLRFCFAELAALPAIIIVAVRAAIAHLVVVWPQRRPLAGGMARASKEAVLGRWT